MAIWSESYDIRAMAEKPKVLVIDDDRPLAQLLAQQLQQAGFPASAAVDPIQGFMFAQRESPGLILLDINLPAGGGFPLLEKLRKTPRTKLIPVIVITAAPDPEMETQARAKGAEGFLRKPITNEAMIAEVERVLAVG